MNDAVRVFETMFAERVNARYAIALCNGTATLHTALAALGVGRTNEPYGDPHEGDRVAVPPLTMASTTIAVLHAGGVPVFVDVDPDTWLMRGQPVGGAEWVMPVSLYGLHTDWLASVDDAAQTLRPHGRCHFTSYSLQASKILALGEGGMLVTNDEDLAIAAREFSSLGYAMLPDDSGIDPNDIKDPDSVRHWRMGWNYRMAPAVAERGQIEILFMRQKKFDRRTSAELYREAIAGCDWITPQHVPSGWEHDYWCYAVALESADLWHPFVDAVIANGGEKPYGAWRLTYQEPAFRHLAEDGTCPVAEDLQPRLVQFQTNDVETAAFNAEAIRAAIREIGG